MTSRTATKSSSTRTSVPKSSASARSVTRLHVTVPDSLQSKLDELAEASHATSTAEVFRNALTVYAALVDAHKEGKRVYIQKPDGSERELLRLFI